MWDNEEEDEGTWEQRVAKKYYDKLFKEYAICDLKYYKQGKIALRWRTESEVISGKGNYILSIFACYNPTHFDQVNLYAHQTAATIPKNWQAGRSTLGTLNTGKRRTNSSRCDCVLNVRINWITRHKSVRRKRKAKKGSEKKSPNPKMNGRMTREENEANKHHLKMKTGNMKRNMLKVNDNLKRSASLLLDCIPYRRSILYMEQTYWNERRKV